jgi:riboflavin kinase/FMN adenylyltransferase
VARAADFLGHAFELQGVVVSGFGRGAALGFPTANVQAAPAPAYQLLPATGIYAAYLWAEGERHPAAVSIGTNPVFDGVELTVEAHVLDFQGDLRAKVVRLEFLRRIRDEIKFDGVEALVAEMHRDVERVRSMVEAAGYGSRPGPTG